MSFPYSLKKNINFSQSDYWLDDLPNNFHQLFIESLKKRYNYQEGYFQSTHSFFNVSFKFEIQTNLKSNLLKITYHLHLQNLINVIIALLLLSAFLSNFSFGVFLWASFIISIGFYQISLLIINTGIRKQVYQILAAYKKVKEESDIEYWVKENDRNCPACGEKLDNQTLFCKECGLKIRQNAYSKPLNLNMELLTQKREEESIVEENELPQVNYQYKKKNDK